MKARLERRNAMKNIDYQVPSFHDTNTSSSIHLSPSLRNQTTFRIHGDFDHIFRTLGLSGPEDFAIPTAAWEQAQKSRFASSPVASNNNNKVVAEQHQLPPKLDVVLKNSSSHQPGVEVEGKENDGVEFNFSSDSSKFSGENRDGGGGGINGIRPPLLAPPRADEVTTSTWYLKRSFATHHDHDDDDAPSGKEDVRDVEENGQRNLLSGSSSSTSHDDNDDSDVGGKTEKESHSSMVVDESIHDVSPNGSFRRTFSSWQKGEILGKGSFGTVYEGFTE